MATGVEGQQWSHGRAFLIAIFIGMTVSLFLVSAATSTIAQLRLKNLILSP